MPTSQDDYLITLAVALIVGVPLAIGLWRLMVMLTRRGR